VFPGVDDNLKLELFKDATTPGTVWVGEIYILRTEQELIPVRFGGQNFLVGFSSPTYEAGDEESMEMFSLAWADGYIPAAHSRMVKFSRTEANAEHFKPDVWHLDTASQVFQFSQTLADAVAFHAQTYPTCRQYLFWPASHQLELLYKRAFRYVDRACLPGEFRPILQATGVFNGYERT
jgi:hypothetical protein